MTLQNNLANFSFLTLLGSLIFYWIGFLFNDVSELQKKQKVLSSGNTVSVPSSVFGFGPLAQVNQDKKGNFSLFSFSFLANVGILLSNLVLGFLLLLRWQESGHFPLSNLYESLMFLSWCFTTLHLGVEYYTYGILQKNFEKNILGSITTPSALLINAFATFTLPKEMQEATPLVPALQSNWLMMHVTVMVLSYAALILGSLLAIAFLVVTSFGSPNKQTISTSTTLAFTLDNLSYRILGLGFPFLTIGILSGAVWANEAWGSYWSWDPKETWALLTWLIFAIYLHTRISKGWSGKKPAFIASFGFIVVWICYLGVNLIGEGLHSYGWLS